jgi:hypothetical protein
MIWKREKGSQVKNAMQPVSPKIPLSKISEKGGQFLVYRFPHLGGMGIKALIATKRMVVKENGKFQESSFRRSM